MVGSATVDPTRNHRLMACERLGQAPPPQSSELAVRAFDAEIKFNEALSNFQADYLPAGQLCSELERSPAEFLKAANRAGFSWSIRTNAATDSLELILAHDGGFQVATMTAPAGLLPALLGLLGVLPPTAAQEVAFAQPAEPEGATDDEAWLSTLPSLKPSNYNTDVGHMTAVAVAESLAGVAAKSLADVATRSDPTTPLTTEQQATAQAMVEAMAATKLKAFGVAFRNAFNVPRMVTSLKPLITQQQHLEFIDRFTTEAAGEVAT